MKYSLEFNGIQQKVMDKFPCFDAVHEMGSYVKGEAYTLSHNAIHNGTELMMEYEQVVIACKVFIGLGS